MKESNILMKIIFLIALFLLLPVKAEIPLEKYYKFKDLDVFQEYIWGVSMGYSWANANLDADDRAMLFCEPQYLSLNKENIYKILENEIKDYGHLYSKDVPIAQILFNALSRTFPCDK